MSDFVIVKQSKINQSSSAPDVRQPSRSPVVPRSPAGPTPQASTARLNNDNKQQKSYLRVVYMIALCATIGGFLFGYDSAIVNGALIVMEKDFVLSEFWKESIVTSTVAGAALFSILAGGLADTIGRKKAIMMSAVVFTVGSIVMATAPDLTTILVGRFIVGAAIGLVSCIVPIYVSECAPKEIRGYLLTLNQLFITLGIALAAIIAGILQHVPRGWRYMFGIGAIPGVVQLIFFVRLPESPRYLVMKDNVVTAEGILRLIRSPDDDIIKELREIKESVDIEEKNKGCRVWLQVFRTRHVRKALFIGCSLQMFQQLTGINTIIYYSATILLGVGFDSSLAVWLSVIPASVNFLATFLGLMTVERIGRRVVLAVSFFAVAISCLVLSLGDIAGMKDSPPTYFWNDPLGSYTKCAKYSNCYQCLFQSDKSCGYCARNEGEYREMGACVQLKQTEFGLEPKALDGRCSFINDTTDDPAASVRLMTDYCPNKYAFLSVAGLVLFVLSFAPGAGPMPWTINAEIYPMWARSVCTSIATLTNWLFNAIVSFVFVTMVKTVQINGTFFIFLVISLSATVFTALFVPETKGKSLEEIEWLFMDQKARVEHRQKTSDSPTVRKQPSKTKR